MKQVFFKIIILSLLFNNHVFAETKPTQKLVKFEKAFCVHASSESSFGYVVTLFKPHSKCEGKDFIITKSCNNIFFNFLKKKKEMYGDLFHIKKNKEFFIDQKKLSIKCEEQKKLEIEREKKIIKMRMYTSACVNFRNFASLFFDNQIALVYYPKDHMKMLVQKKDSLVLFYVINNTSSVSNPLYYCGIRLVQKYRSYEKYLNNNGINVAEWFGSNGFIKNY